METNINVVMPRVDRLAKAARRLDGLRDGLRMLSKARRRPDEYQLDGVHARSSGSRARACCAST